MVAVDSHTQNDDQLINTFDTTAISTKQILSQKQKYSEKFPMLSGADFQDALKLNLNTDLHHSIRPNQTM